MPEAVLSSGRRQQWMNAALEQLQLISGGDPDDMALGVLAQRRL